MATRRTQPYRMPELLPKTQVVANILRGRSAIGFNPQDAKRMAQRLARSGRPRAGLRPPRRRRPPRPQRPAR